MDLTKIIARAKSILLTPKTEWPVIANETDTVAGLYTGYILVMAAIPALIRFLSSTIIGVSVPFFGTYHVGFGDGLTFAITGYVFSLVGIFVMALIVDALAPTFSGQKSQVQALKAVTYAYTAFWVASIIGIVPGLAIVAALAGLVYGIYLLRLGLPATMKCPDDKAVGYTVASIIAAIVVSVILSLVVGALVGPKLPLGRGSLSLTHQGSGFSDGSAGAALQKWAQSMQAASEKVQAAQKSGDTAAQANAVGQAVSAALGGGGKVESLPPDTIKQFVPESLAGLPRTNVSVERNAAMGMQVSTARASYSDGAQRSLNLEITDTGSLKGLVGFATGFAGIEQDKETDSGYEKVYRSGGQLVHEQWNNGSRSGEYSVVVGDRFAVKVSGSAADISELKAAVGSVNLAGLEALKGSGVQAN